MNVSRQVAAVAGCLLAVLLAAGCGAEPGSAHRATMQGCTDYGVHAIEDHVTVTRMPAACRGLSKEEINQAVSKAVDTVAGGRRKVAWRKLAVAVGARLGRLVTSVPPAISAVSGGGQPVPDRRPGIDAALAVAVLILWLLTAGSGSCLLVTWMAHGGLRRERAGPGNLPPAVVVGHFSLAVTGLILWIAYLAAGRTFLAWAAVGLLLAVAGLGMATLSIGLGSPARAPAGIVPPRGGPPVLLIAGHGALAMATLLLALLAVTGVTAH
jgi:hypothetical protein